MIYSSVVATLGQAVGDAESSLFVGRTTERAAFAYLLEGLAHRPGAMYISGGHGIGKTALLRAFARIADQREVPSILVDVRGLADEERPGAALVHALAEHLLVGEQRDGDAGADAVVLALHQRAGSRPFVLLIDGYEAIRQDEVWFRERFLFRLGTGGGVVMSGYRPAVRMWADAPAWRAAVPEFALGALAPAEAEELLDRLCVEEPAARAAVTSLAEGHPRLLVRAAAAVRSEPVWTSAVAVSDPERLNLFFLERVLHPASRRRAWRAGGGDEVMAAAALMPHFDRLTLAAALGRQVVDRAWPSLLEVAYTKDDAGRYALPDALGSFLAQAAVRQRPWAQGQWRRAATAHLARRAQDRLPGSDLAADWSAFVRLATASPWQPFLTPEAEAREGWRCAVEVGSPRRAAVGPSSFRIELRDGGGAVLGVATGTELAGPVALAALPRAVGDYVLALPDATIQRWAGHTLVVRIECADAPPVAWGALLRQAARYFHAFERVVLLSGGQAAGDAGALSLLEFRLDHGWIGTPPAWVLEFGADGYGGWLRRISLPPVPASIGEEERTTAAKEALLHLHDAQKLSRTDAARRYASLFADSDPAAVRTWILDAVHSLGLQHTQAAVVMQYYVERTGSHEEIMQRLDLPRATYFRVHRSALERVGEALFG